MRKWLNIFSRKNQTKTSSPENVSQEALPLAVNEKKSPEKKKSSRSEILDDFERAARYLNIRVYQKDYLSKIQLDEFVYRTDLEGTISMLVLDLPYSVENLLKSEFAKWNKTEDELFEIAFSNLKENYKREVVRYEGTADHSLLTLHSLFTLTGSDLFITSSVFDLINYPAMSGVHGSLVAIPNRTTFITKPIHDDISLEVGLQVLIPHIEKLFEENPEGAVSRHIYWYYNGKIEVIHHNVGLKRFNYVLPLELEDKVY